jgi:hypothetical protein
VAVERLIHGEPPIRHPDDPTVVEEVKRGKTLSVSLFKATLVQLGVLIGGYVIWSWWKERSGEELQKTEVVHNNLKKIYKILKIENNIYLSLGIFLIILFIMIITLIGVCPYYDCRYQVYKENTSNLFITTYYIVLYGLPLWVILTSFVMLFYLIFKRIFTKRKEYNRLIMNLIAYILLGLFIVISFIFVVLMNGSNGKFDFWSYPKDSGELLLILLIIGCLTLRKILMEWIIEKNLTYH